MKFQLELAGILSAGTSVWNFSLELQFGTSVWNFSLEFQFGTSSKLSTVQEKKQGSR
jgi:hypothetical protein